jgi:hypothetical protein
MTRASAIAVVRSAAALFGPVAARVNDLADLVHEVGDLEHDDELQKYLSRRLYMVATELSSVIEQIDEHLGRLEGIER